MNDSPTQMLLFDLPEGSAPEKQETVVSKPTQTPRPRNKSRQLSLDIRLYVVNTGVTACTVQARSPSAAKYLVYRMAKEAGLYRYEGGFLAFVSGGVKVTELRR